MADTNSNTTVAPVAPRKRRNWLKIIVCGILLLLVLLVVAWFVGTSEAFFKRVILPRAGAAMNAKLSVSNASISPFKQVLLRNLKVETTGSEPLLSAAEVRLRYNLMDIMSGRITVQEATLVSPVISIVENADGTSNLDPLFKAPVGKTSQAAPPSKPSTPARLNIARISVTDGMIRQVKIFSAANRNAFEILHADFVLENLRAGETGKMTITAAIRQQANPPAPGSSGIMTGTLSGQLAIALTPDSQPASIQGATRFEVSSAEGSLAPLASFKASMDCNVTPAEIKEVALRFHKGDLGLGEVLASGSLKLAAKEGRLSVFVRDIDRRLLNLAGASSGLDFGSTTITSTNDIEFANGGNSITASGRFNINQLQITQAGQTTPAIDLRTDYSISVLNHVTDLRQVTLALTPTARAANQIQLAGKIDSSNPKATSGNLKITAAALDLTSYYDAFIERKSATPPSATPTVSPQAGPEKEPEPMLLPVANFVIEAALGHIYLHEVDVANLQATVKIDGGKIVVKPCQFALNGAPASFQSDLDLGVPGWKYDFSCNAQAIPLAPLVNSFKPERKGQIGGTLTAQGAIKGKGITGPSLQQNLGGNFDITSTNLNLSIANIRNPMLKTVVNAVSMIPNFAANPESAITSLLGGLLSKAGAGSGGGLSGDLSGSPIEQISGKCAIGGGKLDLQQATVQSPAFQADASGTVTLAPVLTNSTINIPVNIALSRAVAQRIKLSTDTTPADAAYVKLPQFLTVEGTVGQPTSSINKQVLGGTLFKSISGSIQGDGGKTGSIVSGIANRLGLTPSTPATNASPEATNATPAGSLLKQLFK